MIFDEIYSTYFQRLARTARTYSHCPEDVAQMAFVNLLGKSGYEDWSEKEIESYLFGTAKKLALDKRVRDAYIPGEDGFLHEPDGLVQDEREDADTRELGTKNSVPLDLYAAEVPSIAVQHALGLDFSALVMGMLGRLDEEEREVVLLKSEGLNTRMIGELLGMSTDKAGSRFMRACAKMKAGEGV